MYEDMAGDGNYLDIYTSKGNENFYNKPLLSININDESPVWLNIEDAERLANDILDKISKLK